MKKLLTFIINYVNVLKQGVNMSNRPKHSFSKKQDAIETEDSTIEAVEPKVEVEMNSMAYGIYKDKSGDWMVAQLKFDAVSGVAKVSERIATGHGDKTGAIDKFKIEVAKHLFG